MTQPNAPRSLGRPVRIYQGYRRSGIALATLASAAGAALAWWLSGLLDGRIWNVVPAIAAVALSMLALNLLLSLLNPGVRIGVYKRGMIIGKRQVHWDELDHVSIDRVGITDERTGATHEEAEINLHLVSGETIELLLNDETLPFHVDIAELTHSLTSLDIRVVDALADTEHREDASPGIARNPEVAAELRQAFETALDRVATHDDAAPLLAALATGNRDRRLQRLLCLLQFFTYRSLEATVRLVAVLLFVSLLAIAILLLIEVFALVDPGNGNEDVLGRLGLPPGLYRLPFLAVALPLIAKAMKRCWPIADRLGNRARRDLARFRAMHKQAAITEETLAESFTVYLRSFAGEYFRYLETTAERGRDGLAKRYETLERDLDRVVIDATSRHTALLALANSRDASAPAELDTLFVPASQWIDVAALLMTRSRAVILNLSFATESLLAELWALERLEAEPRTFVVIGTHFPLDTLEAEDRDRLDRFQNRARENSNDLSTKLETFLQALAGQVGASSR